MTISAFLLVLLGTCLFGFGTLLMLGCMMSGIVSGRALLVIVLCLGAGWLLLEMSGVNL